MTLNFFTPRQQSPYAPQEGFLLRGFNPDRAAQIAQRQQEAQARQEKRLAEQEAQKAIKAEQKNLNKAQDAANLANKWARRSAEQVTQLEAKLSRAKDTEKATISTQLQQAIKNAEAAKVSADQAKAKRREAEIELLRAKSSTQSQAGSRFEHVG